MGAMREIRRSECVCTNAAFVIPKPSGTGCRLIVDSSPFNQQGYDYSLDEYTSFDTLYTLSSALQPDDWLFSFDLTDGYFHIEVADDSKQYFTFELDGKCYQMLAMPFGWSGSPKTFMQLTRALADILKRAPSFVTDDGTVVPSCGSVSVRVLLDDFLGYNCSKDTLTGQVDYTVKLLTHLGITVNEGKSILSPCQRMQHLGLIIDTAANLFVVPDDKRVKLVKQAKYLLSLACKPNNPRWVPARAVARLAGLALCVSLAFADARYLTRELYTCLQYKSSWQAYIKLSNRAMKDIKALAHLPRVIQSQIWVPDCTAQLISDASDVGWGARIQTPPAQVSGSWSHNLAVRPILDRELYAVYFGLRRFHSELANQVVDVVVDNMAVMYGVQARVLAVRRCMNIIRLIHNLCVQHNITLLPRYVKSACNPVDKLSRFQADSEWTLERCVFDKLQGLFGPFDLDAFASAANAQVSNYCAVFDDGKCSGVDGLKAEWRGRVYCNPPWELLGATVAKIIKRPPSVQVLLLMPAWPYHSWYSKALLHAKRVVKFPAGSNVFVHSYSKCRLSTKWDTLAVWFD
jgi:hypothetical protein